jgi:hypothetical protein
VLEPFALPYLVQLLPAPTVTVNVSGFHFISGHEIGCTARLLQIITPSEPLDQLYLTIQFPRDIVDYKFGGSNVTEYPGPFCS